MSFFDWFTRNRRANEALAASIRENNARLEAIATALNDRESPERIREAIQAGLQDRALEKALSSACERVDQLSSSLRDSGLRPIPVQTFPLHDDFRYEQQKREFAHLASRRCVKVGEVYAGKLAEAHKTVAQAMERFFALLDKVRMLNSNDSRNELAGALDALMHCSPKRIIASFQQNALEAGWALVSQHNCLIDKLATVYPRCRAGIYASRLNYADVIQVSEEILSTLRTSSTLLDDAQRRHDLLEALQGEMLRDLGTPETQMIWDAIFASVKGSIQLSNENDGFFKGLLKSATGVALAPLVMASGAMTAPVAQFQGHLAREHRLRAFIATSLMLNQVWTEWSRINQSIVLPHVQIMFHLKADYMKNKMICICDLLTANGYSLEQLPMERRLPERSEE